MTTNLRTMIHRAAAVAALALSLAGPACAAGAGTLDASTDEKLGASMKALTEAMPEDERPNLEAAFIVITMRAFAGGGDPEAAFLKAFKPYHGMTARAIIAKIEKENKAKAGE